MRARPLLIGALVCAAAGGLAGCAAHKSTPAPAPAAASPADPGVLPASPREEIDRLAAEIDAALAQAGLAAMQPPACAAAASCSAAPMSVAPIANDPTCKPAQTDTCTQSCTLATSICNNAERICKLAGDLGGADAYANEKCESATSSCSTARARCCGCT